MKHNTYLIMIHDNDAAHVLEVFLLLWFWDRLWRDLCSPYSRHTIRHGAAFKVLCWLVGCRWGAHVHMTRCLSSSAWFPHVSAMRSEPWHRVTLPAAWSFFLGFWPRQMRQCATAVVIIHWWLSGGDGVLYVLMMVISELLHSTRSVVDVVDCGILHNAVICWTGGRIAQSHYRRIELQ